MFIIVVNHYFEYSVSFVILNHYSWSTHRYDHDYDGINGIDKVRAVIIF